MTNFLSDSNILLLLKPFNEVVLSVLHSKTIITEGFNKVSLEFSLKDSRFDLKTVFEGFTLQI